MYKLQTKTKECLIKSEQRPEMWSFVCCLSHLFIKNGLLLGASEMGRFYAFLCLYDSELNIWGF